MSDNWDFYFTTINNKPASIFVDLDIGREAPLKEFPHTLHIFLKMLAPRPDGFPGPEDYEALAKVEDALNDAPGGDRAAIYVGRVSTDGHFFLFFFTAAPQEMIVRVNKVMARFPDFKFVTGTKEEPEWDAYFKFLAPSDRDRRCIANRRVCLQLKKQGDPLTEARVIDHFAHFPTESARAAFVKKITELGFAVGHLHVHEATPRPFSVEFTRRDVPDLDRMDEITLSLHDLADAREGFYDGWGTVVETR
ncbi:MAG TPA: DUF695 domain-containing protein [Stellaceae bacterium]|nr:DUF695 domain-containing protein [Stellaceae bacterium]